LSLTSRLRPVFCQCRALAPTDLRVPHPTPSSLSLFSPSPPFLSFTVPLLSPPFPPLRSRPIRSSYLIFISPQKVLLALSGLLRRESALSLVFTVVLVTDVLLQLDHVSGTTYLPVCETRKSAAQNSEDN